jgi:hypothetical protein
VQVRVTFSSIRPLQLLSIPSQTSAVAGGAVHRDQLPFVQVSVPLPHAVEHPRVRFSSITPLQLLSSPSQTSTVTPYPIADSASPSAVASSAW